jgi:hypothetical protein
MLELLKNAEKTGENDAEERQKRRSRGTLRRRGLMSSEVFGLDRIHEGSAAAADAKARVPLLSGKVLHIYRVAIHGFIPRVRAH